MSGNLDIMYVGRNALEAARAGIQNVSDNIANASTPGYHAQRLQLQSTDTYLTSSPNANLGVHIAGVDRIVNETVELRLRESKSKNSGAEARTNILTQADALFGDLNEEGLSPALDELFNAFESLSTQPQDATIRNQVTFAAESLTSQLNTYALGIEQVRQGLNVGITANVKEINSLTSQIAELNTLISGSHETPTDLLDRRDQILGELSQVIGIHTTTENNGSVLVQTENGYTLVNQGSSHDLLATEDADGLMRVHGSLTSGTTDLTESISEGELGGTLVARDQDLKAMQDELDAFAFNFAEAVNGVHREGYGLDSQKDRNFFTELTEVSGAAKAITIDADILADPDKIAAATDPTMVPGDNRNAVLLADLRDEAMSDGQNPLAAVRSVLTNFGDRVQQAENTAEVSASSEAAMTQLQQSISGVSLDEELMSLLEWKQMFDAASKIIQVADEMIGSIIDLKR